ncbi:MAG: hypothetical protein ACRDUV_02655 [Pseudonocardiaceae bacterium]
MADRQPGDLVRPATLVASEPGPNSVLHARTRLDLTVSRADARIRVAVGDYGRGSVVS